MPVAPIMLGLQGLTLSAAEEAYIVAHRPFSFILFARNIASPEQVQRLTEALAKHSPFATPLIAVDQEGGRVQRLTFGGKLPPVRVYGQWFDAAPEAALEACTLHATLLAAQLRQVGATWLLGPCLDVAHPQTHAIIGDRAFHTNPAVVAQLGAAYVKGVTAGGCFGCLKHAPGHGLAVSDSHAELPRVEAPKKALLTDAEPFAALAPNAPFLMTAHIHFPKWDAAHPATYSKKILRHMRTEWHFEGMLLADDVGMHALSGPYPARITQALKAGCHAAIAALSVVRHGMAGTVWDAENFKALQQAELPPLKPQPRAFCEHLTLPSAPTAAEYEEFAARFRALWATRPAHIQATMGV